MESGALHWNSSGSCSQVSSMYAFIECSPLAPYAPLVLLSLFTSLLFYMLATAADEYLCPALIHISKKLGLSESVAGVTLVAFGNGAPDIFSALSGIRQSRSSMVFTQLFGSGAFVSAMVTGLVMFIAPPFTVDWASFSRDIFFYLSGSIFTFYVFYRSKIHFMHAVAFIAMYIVYIGIVGAFSYWSSTNEAVGEDDSLFVDSDSMYSSVSMKTALTSSVGHVYRLWKQIDYPSFVESLANSTSSDLTTTYGTFSDEASFDSDSLTDDGKAHFIIAELLFHVMPWSFAQFKEMRWYSKLKSVLTLPVHLLLSLTVPIVDADERKHNWCKILNTVHTFVTPTVIVCLYGLNVNIYGVPVHLIVLLASSILGVALFCLSSYNRQPRYHFLFAILGFVASLAWIYRVCETLVSTLCIMGSKLGIPESILGLTVLSWGNSIGDLVTDVTIARHGFASMAISAAFGGTLFDMLLGLGVPYVVVLAQEEDWTLELDWSYTILPVFAGLVSLLVAAPAMLWANKWRSSKAQGIVFIAIYFTMLVASVAVSIAEVKHLL